MAARLSLLTSLLPTLTQSLDTSVDYLLGQPDAKVAGKRDPSSRLEQQIERIVQLPRTKQRFVIVQDKYSRELRH